MIADLANTADEDLAALGDKAAYDRDAPSLTCMVRQPGQPDNPDMTALYLELVSEFRPQP